MESIVKPYKSINVFISVNKLPIYDSKIMFVRYNNKVGFNEAIDFCKKIGLNADEYATDDYFKAYGFTVKERSDLGYIHLLFINNKKDYREDYLNTLAHENYHLVKDICKHHGLEYTESGHDEHIAYLTGYLLNYLSKL